MIDAVTRARWRAVFDAASREPWAVSVPGAGVVVMPATREPVVTVKTFADAPLVALARAEWPRTLQELEACEVERDAARVEVERAQNDHREDVAIRERDYKASVAELTGRITELTGRCQVLEEMVRIAVHDRTELDRLRPLALAMTKWRKFHYNPELERAIEAFEKAGGA